jgi:ribosome-associated heat shock protein Hsp15
MSNNMSNGGQQDNGSVRIDKWLWAARFFKTRSLAADAVDRGRVRIGGEPVKPARSVKVRDKIFIDNGSTRWEVEVLDVSDKRGPAPVAQALYRETEDSIVKRANDQEARRLFPEPGSSIKGRPTKRDRRAIGRVGGDEY